MRENRLRKDWRNRELRDFGRRCAKRQGISDNDLVDGGFFELLNGISRKNGMGTHDDDIGGPMFFEDGRGFANRASRSNFVVNQDRGCR